jgi:hypothetical protein
VAVDLFDLAGPAALAEALAVATISNRSAVRRTLPKARSLSRHAVQLASGAVSARLKADLGTDIEIALLPDLAQRDPERYLAYALRLPEKVAEVDGVEVVVFIDEFQELAAGDHRFGDPDLRTKQLRSVLQDSPHVTCIFAGSIEHLMRDLFAPRHRALHNFGGFQHLGPISVDDWRAGLTERFAEDGCHIAPEILDVLIDEYGRSHARSTMLVAQQTHIAAVAAGVRTITLALVLEGLQNAMSADSAHHQAAVDRIRSLGKHAFATALRVARHEAPYGGVTDPKTVTRAMHALRDIGYIDEPAERAGPWRFADPLLGRYLAGF